MKNLILIAIIAFQLFGNVLFAKEFDLRISSKTNLTFIPNFTNRVLIINDGVIVPGLISPVNSMTPLLVSTSYTITKAQLGFAADINFQLNIGNNSKLSFSCGFSQMKFAYDTYVNVPGMPQIKLNDISQHYGNTNLYYLNLNPLDLSLGFLKNKFVLQFGPSVNFLLRSSYHNTAVIYKKTLIGGTMVDIEDKVYFDSYTGMSKMLYGVNLRSEYNISKYISLFVESQYYFNSIFKNNAPYGNSSYGDKATYSKTLKESRPLQMSAGVNLVLRKFRKKNEA